MANTRNDIQSGNKANSERMGNTQDKSSEVVNMATEQGKKVAEQAEQRARSVVNTRKEEAAEQLDSIASAFRETGNQLRNQNNDAIARYTDSMADQVERFAEYLHNGDYGRFLSDAERLARRQPELFLGGAFTLGLLAARFFRSSSPQRGYSGYRGSQFSGGQSDWQRYGTNWDYEQEWQSRGRYEGSGYGGGYGQSGYRGSAFSGQRYETDETENYSGSSAASTGMTNRGVGNTGMTAGSSAGQTTKSGQTTSRRSFDAGQEDTSEKK